MNAVPTREGKGCQQNSKPEKNCEPALCEAIAQGVQHLYSARYAEALVLFEGALRDRVEGNVDFEFESSEAKSCSATQALVCCGIVWGMVGRRDKREQFFERARRLAESAPNDGGLLLLAKGITANSLGQHTRAVEIFTQFIRENSDSPLLAVAHCARGFAFSDLHLKARADYMRALELQPGYSSALNNLGTSYMDCDPEIASEYFDRAISADPENAFAWSNKAEIEISGRFFRRASKTLDEALAKFPHEDRFYELRVGLYARKPDITPPMSDCFAAVIDAAPLDALKCMLKMVHTGSPELKPSPERSFHLAPSLVKTPRIAPRFGVTTSLGEVFGASADDAARCIDRQIALCFFRVGLLPEALRILDSLVAEVSRSSEVFGLCRCDLERCEAAIAPSRRRAASAIFRAGTEILYRPGGAGYLAALAHFRTLAGVADEDPSPPPR